MLLSEILADRGQILGGDRLLQSFWICLAAHTVVTPGGNQSIVWRQHWINKQPEVIVHTRPSAGLRPIDHPCTYRIEVDLTIDGHQLRIRVDEAGPETPLPQWPAPTMTAIEGLRITLAEPA